MDTPRLVATGLRRDFGAFRALNDCHLTIAAGVTVAVVGASGTGKSTLLHTLAGLDTPQAGSVRLDGIEMLSGGPAARARRRAKRIGFVFQAFHLLRDFNARENVLLAARAAGEAPTAWTARADELLERLGLAARATADVRTLSGGERQRLAIARALLLRPRLVLADEPTGNLDPATAATVLDEFLRLATADGAAVVLVTHDPGVAARCDRRERLADGRLTSA
jgi:ABC-type lipoprotein export system ATPase subunit